MAFPISRTRTFQVESAGDPSAAAEPAMAAIEEWLAARGAARIQRSGNVLAFRAGFVPLLTDWSKRTSKRLAVGWNPLMTVGSGRVAVAETADGLEVTYSLRFTELIVISVILCLLFAAATPESAQINRWASAAWLALGPFGYLVASTGVGVALENVVRQAAREV
ncbi:MAG: hypothetical protein AAF495_27490 [Pseudomonadota bacterium]